MRTVRLLETEIPWPEAGDCLIGSGADWQNNACVDFEFAHPDDRWSLYADGFKLCAELAVEHVMATGSDQDILVYPTFFNYRHYVELRLKEIIRQGSALLNRKQEPRRTHKLNELWIDCREVLEAVWPEGSTQDLDIVAALVQEFVDLDPTATSFRYADRDVSPSARKVKHINLRHLGEVMGRMSSLLDASSCGIVAMLDEKRSVEADYARYYGC